MRKALCTVIILILAMTVCACNADSKTESTTEDISLENDSVFARLTDMDTGDMDFAKLYEFSLDGYETEHVSLRAEWIADGINVYYRALPEEYEKDMIIRSWNDEIIYNDIKYYTSSYHVHADTFTAAGARNYYNKLYKYNDCEMSYYLTYSSEQNGVTDIIETAQAVKAFEDAKNGSCDFEGYLEYWALTLKKEDERIHIKIYPSDYGNPLFDEFIDEEHVEPQHKDDTEYYYGAKIMPNPEVMEQKLMIKTGIGIIEIEASVLTAGQKEREDENNVVNIDIAQMLLTRLLDMQ